MEFWIKDRLIEGEVTKEGFKDRIKSELDLDNVEFLHDDYINEPCITRAILEDSASFKEDNTCHLIVFHSPTNSLFKDLKLLRRGVGIELDEIKHVFSNEQSNFLIIDLQASADNLFFSFALSSTLPTNQLFFAVLRKTEETETGKREEDAISDLQPVLHDQFLDEKIISEWNKEFTDSSVLIASNFFNGKFSDDLVKELRESLNSSKMKYLGPADYRHFNRIPINEIVSFSRLHRLLTGSNLANLVQKISGLRLTGLLQLDVRRISTGSYQMFNDRYSEPYGLDLIITLVASQEKDAIDCLKQDGGQWLYLVEGEEVARIPPRHNNFALAYRVDGCHRFMPLICPSAGNVEIFQILATLRVGE